MTTGFQIRLLLLTFGLFGLTSQWSFAQTIETSNYWVYLSDREPSPVNTRISPATIQSRINLGLDLDQVTDQRPSSALIKQVSATGAQLRFLSKWLGAISVSATTEQINRIKEIRGVTEIHAFGGVFLAASTKGQVNQEANADNPSLYPALAQMQTDAFINKGLTGKGIKMGLIDAGFRDADLTPVLSHLQTRKAVKSVRDFVVPKRSPRFFRGPADSLDTHGTTVLKMVAGYDSTKARWLGCATGVDLYLARTDDAKHEYRAEEDQWLAAMEWMDSSGVRLINSSLGYGKGFDKESDNYKPSDITGKTTAVSKAAAIAVNQKGLMVVVSAGNEGEDEAWGIIASPADAEGVLTVGATVGKPYKKAGYSGIGPAKLPYLKPDLAAYSLTGTSFSSPAVAGFVACLMEANPTLSNKQLHAIMRRSSSLYPYANNYLGAGFPSAPLALEAAAKPNGWEKGSSISSKLIRQNRISPAVLDISDSTTQQVVVFHKSNKTMVIKQEILTIQKGKLSVASIQAENLYSTVMLPDQVVEIEWK